MQRYNYEIESLIDDVKEEHNYLSETKKEVLNNVKGNYPQLCTYESEWIYFDETGYNAGEPVKIEFQTVEGTDGIVENAIPFHYKSAILKGQTLVNNLKETTLPVVAKISGNIDIPIITKINKGERYYVYIDIEIPSGSTRNLIGFLGKSKWQSYCPQIKSGINKVALDADSDLTEYLRIQKDKGTILKSVVMMKEDVEFINQFWGMKSVQMPVLTTTGKNLVKQELFSTTKQEEYYSSGIGNLHNTKIPIDIDGVVTFSCLAYQKNVTGGRFVFYYTDGEKQSCGIISSTDVKNPSNIVSTSKSGKKVQYISFDYSSSTDGAEVYFKKLQVESGSVATSFEPHKSNILTVNEEIKLRGIGDVKDELNCLTGEMTERIGEIVLDGSHDTIIGTDNVESSKTMQFFINAYENGIVNHKQISDKLTYKYSNGDFEHFYISSKRVIVFVEKSKLATQDTNGFNQYLSQNPITVQYQLTTESVKTVGLTSICRPFEGVNHFTTSSDTIPPSMSLQVPVVSTGEQTLQEIND